MSARPRVRRRPASAGGAAWQLPGVGALVVGAWWPAERVLAVLLPGAVALAHRRAQEDLETELTVPSAAERAGHAPPSSRVGVRGGHDV